MIRIVTTDEGEKLIHLDLFEETVRFPPNHPITITHPDGTFNFYLLDGAVPHDGKWIVPLQLVSEADEAAARRAGTIGHFVEGEAAVMD